MSAPMYMAETERTPTPAILMRKLPKATSNEALRSMLLFAKDFIDAEFVSTEYPEDSHFLTAVARFHTLAAAEEVRALLDGKPNTANEANMIVEILSGNRRNSARRASNAVSVPSGGLIRQSSRFNSTFQSMDKLSPPSVPTSSADFSPPDGNMRFQNFFSPQSPLGSNVNERSRISGKSMIDQDAVDDETGDILKDPLAYARNGHSGSATHVPRRQTNSDIPIGRMNSLSLSTQNLTSPAMSGFASPRSAAPIHTPGPSAMSPNSMNSMGPNAGYQLAGPYINRHNYPPVNPADQNPPCNTLYVGNLPVDTSEDELKAMFCKQRGYKRLCFRTKQNGPMCFVEFEDISFATKALNELYGVQLHNSVKGGIRLSFSKNPLGVRTGQPGSMNPSTPMTPQGQMSGTNSFGPTGHFATANGPPPGLSAPPGLGMPNGPSMNSLSSPVNPHMQNGSFSSNSFGMSNPVMGSMRNNPFNGGMNANSLGAGVPGTYSDYMMGR